jgi:S-adenosylmethionine:tRNA ribosyltransferase-isomerase
VRLADFDYALPEELIAQRPAAERDASRLLVLSADAARPEHRRFVDLPALVPAGALLVVNDARVIPARLHARKPSGGRIEVLLTEPDAAPGVWRALVRGKLDPGTPLRLEPPRGRPAPAGAPPALTFVERLADGTARVALPAGPGALEGWGELPLPPYIARPEGLEAADDERYQTMFAAAPGAVAAPTAGLHFTPAVDAALAARGVTRVQVTLHVGLGTFAPVRVDDLADHVMHVERYDVPAATTAAYAAARAAGRPVVAVGTTVVRTLESAVSPGGATLRAGPGETRLFITPGHCFRAVDWLVTNFHLPRSTLLVLVSAFAGRERVLAAYAEAVRERYRFFSYGDAMLLEHCPAAS